MSVPAAYAAVIAIWSITPLGLVWSNESLSPIAAASLRISIAAALGWLFVKAVRIELPWHGKALRVYGFSVIGIFLGMLLSYLGAKSVPSGLISVMFSLSPVISGLLAHLLINDRTLTPLRVVAFVVAIGGMATIFLGDSNGATGTTEGLIFVVCSVLFFCLSGVLVKGESSELHFMSITVGALILSVPCYVLSWMVFDGEIPVLDWSSKSPWAVIFLAVFGSLIGFGSYFYVLQKLPPSTVTMVTLVTPIFALILGSTLNHEILDSRVYWGCTLVLSGLALYIWSDKVTRFIMAKAA
ncbi:MAG: DMT family transporter [Hahellaceae bacterium]|nr:DMT family transporter [Hahellaceae bacterium]MCP5209893.1 DMT family transporter [Hahellaceae bacterium]